MKIRIFRHIFLITGIFLLSAFIFSATRGSGEASDIPEANSANPVPCGGNINHFSLNPLSRTDSEAWTRERMLAAKPYPLQPIDQELNFSLQLDQSQSSPGFIPGSSPAAGNLPLTDVAIDQDQATSNGYSYPAPFARYQNFDSYQVYPYSTVGMLFFTQYGVDYHCSAASIGNNAIWTAGHCIHKGDNRQNGWSYNIAFAPAFKNGNTPFGVWSVSQAITKQSWYEYGDLRCDMAGAVLNKYEDQKISDIVGSLGFAYNQVNGLHWMNIAYPSSAPFNGMTQQICAGSFAYEDTSAPEPFPVAMGCDMTQGSSGGPWILNFGGLAGQTNFLNGNNSYRYSYHPKELFSPYFGNAAKILYDALISG